MISFLDNFWLSLPEVFLIISCMSLICFSVLYITRNITIGKLLSVQIGVVGCLIIILFSSLYLNTSKILYDVFANTIVSTELSKFFVFLVLLGILIIFGLALHYMKRNTLNVPELFLIILLVLTGFIVLLNANDFLVLYLGLELQSLGLYILATLKQNSIYATEAGLKYFILGAFASCLLVLGISIIYSFSGILSFTELNFFLTNLSEENMQFQGIFLGIGLVLISFLFKIGAAPFHVWLPDVYEGAATIITAFFSLVPKLVIFNLLLKFIVILDEFFKYEIQYIFIYCSIFSIVLASLGAVYQFKIKRLLSYSAIGHTGFILLAISLYTIVGYTTCIFYILIYYVLIINIFAILLQLQKKDTGDTLKYIANLNYILQSNKLLGTSLILVLFSLAGIPPLSGFFSKFYLLVAIMQNQYYFIAFIIIILSIFGAIYYLKVIRNIIFFKNYKKNYLLLEISSLGSYIIIYTTAINILCVFFNNLLLYFCMNLFYEIMY